jgi:hypothetical protein
MTKYAKRKVAIDMKNKSRHQEIFSSLMGLMGSSKTKSSVFQRGVLGNLLIE